MGKHCQSALPTFRQAVLLNEKVKLIKSTFEHNESTIRILFSKLDRGELLGCFEVFLSHGTMVDMTDAFPPLPSPVTPTTAVAGEPPLEFVHPKRVHIDPANEINPKAAHLDFQISTPVVLHSLDLPALPIQSYKPIHPHGHHSISQSNKSSSASSGRRQADPSDELMIDFSYKVQMRFLETNTPEKYKTFLSLLSTSRASPSSYPAAIFQATQLLKSHPDLLSEFRSLVARVSFAGIQPALTSSSPSSGGAPVVCGSASAAAGRKGHRKSKSLSTWLGITPIGSEGVRDGSFSLPSVSTRHGRRRSGSKSPPHIEEIEGVPVRRDVVCASPTVVVDIPGAASVTGLSERTPLLMSYEDWCVEHERRTVVVNTAGVESGVLMSANGVDGGRERGFLKRWGAWLWRGVMGVGVVGCLAAGLGFVGTL
ncbi:hypothetical protein HDU98_008461 [Podochytrium sp. JEL0797]|nr:hypothetical protein HDU98_008461 [Podochytrium sp. JEL0797]